MLSRFANSKYMPALIAIAVYLPTMFFGWIYLDDYLLVQESAFYTNLGNIAATFSRQVWLPTGGEYMYYRPVSTSLYVLSGWFSTLFSSELEAWSYHLTNLVLTAGVVALAFEFFQALKLKTPLPLVLTLLLIAHPASVATVAWVSGQNELLLALFVLGGFVAFLRAIESVRPTWFFVLYGLCLLGALLTKENALALMPLSALYLLTRDGKGREVKSWLLTVASWIGAVVIWLLLLSQGAGQSAPGLGGAGEAMLKGFGFMFIFLGKMLLPFELNTLPIPKDTSPIVFAAGLFAGLLLAVVGIWQIRRRPLILFGLAWFVAFLLPTFAKMNLVEADTFILRGDRSFLASIGILLSASQLVDAAIKPRRWWKYAGAATLLVFLGLNVFHQFDYRDGMSFYRNAAEKSPSLAFAHTHLADMYLRERNFAKAAQTYERALSINGTEYNAHNNLGVTYERMGNSEKAIAAYDQELKLYPTNILSLFNKGSILIRRGIFDEGEALMRRVVEINPAHKDAWAVLLTIYRNRGERAKFEEAERNFQKAELDMSKGI